MKNRAHSLSSCLILSLSVFTTSIVKAETPELLLTLDTTYLFDTICDGDQYVWNGITYNQGGMFIDTLMDMNGDDSILVLFLEELASDTTIISYTICSDQPSPFTGEFYENPDLGDSTVITESYASENEFGCIDYEITSLVIYPVGYWLGWGEVLVGSEVNGVVYDVPGIYGLSSIQCCDEHGCNTYIDFTLYVFSSTSELEKEINLNLFPNPFENEFRLSFDLPKAYNMSAYLYDLMGKKIKDLTTDERLPAGLQQLQYEVAELPNGVYNLRLQFDEEIIMKKLVKYSTN